MTSVGDEGGGGRHSNQGKGRQSKGSSSDRPSDSNDHNESEQSHRKEAPSSSSHAAGDTGSAATSNTGLNNSFVESVVQVALGQICCNIGWHSIGSLSLDILTEVTGSYIKSLGRSSARFANQAGRSAVTLSDVVLAFEQLHFNLNELQDYVSSVEPHPIPFRINKIPAKIRPSNRLQFRQQEEDNENHPFKEDTVIGYAVTDSEEEDDEDVEEDLCQKKDADQVKMESNEDLVDPVTGQVLQSTNNEDNKQVKERKRIPLKRSEYYEEWMPPFPVIEDELDKNKDREETGKDTDKDASLSQDESSMSIGIAAGPEEALNGLKLSEIEPSAPLTSVYLNSSGQLVPVNGAVAIQADKSFPEFSDPESASESEEEDEPLNKSNDMDVNGFGGLYSTEGRQSLVDKITIKKDRMLNKSDKKTKRQGGDKLNRLISKQTKDKSSKGSSVPVLSIKVSGLITGTPTASPKLPSMMMNSEQSIPLPPEVEERMDDTIESVIESAMSSSRKIEKKPREKKAREPRGDKNKPQKEYSSKEFVDDDDDDSSSDDDASRGATGIMEPVPPVLLSNSKSSFKKNFSPEKEMKSSPGRSLSPDEHRYRSPAEKNSPRKHPVPPPTKAASKAYSTPSPSATKINDKDAAEILMSFSTNPVDQLSSKAMSPSSSSPVDSSPFNLGKILERSRVGQQMIGSPSETHPFAPNPPQSLPPIRTLAMKKAVYQETRDRQSESDESNEDEEDVKKESKKKKVKEDDDDESLERKKSKKDKKKKKKESKDRDKKDRDRKKDKKEKKRKEREELAATIESVPRLNIKLSKPEASKESLKTIKDKDVKIKKEKSSADPSASNSCLLFTETIKQSSSVDLKSKGMKKENLEAKKGSKKLKEEEEVSKAKASKTKSKGKKKDEEEAEDGDEEGDKIWICPSCKLPDDGSPMIGCDNCEEWYHWVCVGIKIDPDEDSWFCPRCKDKQKKMEQLIQGKGGTSVVGKRKRNDSTASKTSSTASTKKKRKKKKPG